MSRAAAKPAGVVDSRVLAAALKDVQAAIETRNTIPILSHVLLTIAPGRLTMIGTDLDIWIERTAGVDAGTAFTVAVEAATLGRLAGKFPADAQVTITLDESKVIITSGRSRFTLPILPVADFPVLPSVDWDAEFEIESLLFGRALARVSHAISTDETRYYLNGVFVHVADAGDALRFAATDGHRLARVSLDTPDGAFETPGIIIPRKAARALSSLLDRAEGKVEVAISTTKLRVILGDTTLTTKTIDGQFPDYTRVIPTGNSNRVEVERSALIDAVGRVATVSSDKLRAVKIDLARDVMTLSVTSPEHGQSTEDVPCSYTGEALTVGFNSRYLLDTLGQLAADTIEGHFGDSAAPVMWRDGENTPALYVLMPFRV